MKIDTGFGVEIEIDHERSEVSIFRDGECQCIHWGLQRNIKEVEEHGNGKTICGE